MLQYFSVKRYFNKLAVSISVDCEHAEAEINVSYDRVLKRSSGVHFHEVDTPEKAEAYLRQHVGERGSLLEALEQQYRSEAA